MQRTLTIEIPNKVGETVHIAGWVSARRNMGKIVFLDILDRTGIVQVVVSKESLNDRAQGDNVDIIDDIRPQWVVRISGLVKGRSEKAKNNNIPTGSVEIEAQQIEIESKAEELPFDMGAPKLDVNLDTLLNYQPLTLRHASVKPVFELQAGVVEHFRTFLRSQGFTEFQSPKIVAGDAEGGASVMKVDYVGHEASLAQSPQLYKQIMVGVFERVFTVGNVFRGERHNTSRHLNEYTSLDFEMGFINDATDVMRMQNDWLISLEKLLREKFQYVFNLFHASIPEVPQTIPSLHFRDAQDVIEKEFGEKCKGEPDLSPQHERWLCEYSKKQWNSDFIYITHYPNVKRAFYTMPDESDPEFTHGFDLLFRGLEITSGARRVENYELLRKRMKERGLNEADFEFYLSAFKYGLPKHGGIGFGLERFIANLLNFENVRYATLFPRDIDRIDLPLKKG